MNNWYFILGFIIGFLSLLIIRIPEQIKARTKQKTWSEVKNLDFEFNMDEFKMDEPMTSQEIAQAVAEIMQIKTKNMNNLKKVKINKGNYSISIKVLTRFIKRD